MNRNYIKWMIIQNIEETCKNRDARFIRGKVIGIVEAFKMMGKIDMEDTLVTEIMAVIE